MTKPHDANDEMEDRDYIENAKALADRLLETINANDDLTEGEIFTALMEVTASILAGMECPNCRRQKAKLLKKIFPKFIADALADAADRDEQELASNHVH